MKRICNHVYIDHLSQVQICDVTIDDDNDLCNRHKLCYFIVNLKEDNVRILLTKDIFLISSIVPHMNNYAIARWLYLNDVFVINTILNQNILYNHNYLYKIMSWYDTYELINEVKDLLVTSQSKSNKILINHVLNDIVYKQWLITLYLKNIVDLLILLKIIIILLKIIIIYQQ